MVYFVLALCLFSSSGSAGPPGYRVVLRSLTEKLRHLPGGFVQRQPTSSALTRARQRLGGKPLQALFERRCGPLAPPACPAHRPQDRPAQAEKFRLATSPLDHRHAPARQLAQLYHQRREIENGFAELKNRLRGAGFILRSKTPELVCQEIYALLTVYQAVCALKAHAAEQGEVDPERSRSPPRSSSPGSRAHASRSPGVHDQGEASPRRSSWPPHAQTVPPSPSHPENPYLSP
ncbi:hypothetical protein GCM10009535_51150 [Streptomyces thermocarboxydovorans]|uniref:Transposase n=1 Tax=Streptomyces thermocarboxydovorans TaxID=59298 RepID=A0ABN1HS94_9ACTN